VAESSAGPGPLAAIDGAGSAGGVLQTAQRIGSAVGIAAVGSVFFSHVTADHGDWSGAFQRGVAVASAFVLAALLVAAFDVVGGHRRDR